MSDVWYFTSDIHWNHVKIQSFTGRPWDVYEQEEAIIEIWNSQVKPGQNVAHLGDWTFGTNKKEFCHRIMKRLNGNIFHILGNHCNKNDFTGLYQEFGGRILGIEYYKEIKLNKKRITLCHFPQMVWNNSHHGSWSLFGHCHGSLVHPGKALDVGLDNSIKVLGEYRLFTFDDIQEYMKDRDAWCPDMHNAKTT